MTTIVLDKSSPDLVALVERALAGEEILIVLGEQKVRLAPVPVPPFDEKLARERGYGSLAGRFHLTDAFFDLLPDDELAAWEGRENE